jgi:hypothetical protein
MNKLYLLILGVVTVLGRQYEGANRSLVLTVTNGRSGRLAVRLITEPSYRYLMSYLPFGQLELLELLLPIMADKWSSSWYP